MDSTTVKLNIFVDQIFSSDLPSIMRAIEKVLHERGVGQDILLTTVIDDVHYNCGKQYGKDIVMFKNDHKYICKHG